MKNVIRLASLLLLISITLTGCYYDKENELYPSPKTVCDTTHVTYSKSIVPIMVANCNVCHSTALQQGYIITDTYNDLSGLASPDGPLYNGINWVGGVSKMPKGGAKLSDCDVAKINIWIRAGAPNN